MKITTFQIYKYSIDYKPRYKIKKLLPIGINNLTLTTFLDFDRHQISIFCNSYYLFLFFFFIQLA